MKQFLVSLLALSLLGGLIWLVGFRRSPEHAGAVDMREIATRGLAGHLAKSGQGKRVLVIANPFAKHGKLSREMQDMESAGLRGLEAGFGSRSQFIVAWPELKPGVLENPRAVFIDPETTTPLSYLVADDAFDKLAQQHADCDVIVSLIGLPANLTRVRCWQNNSGPKFALLLPDLRIIGDRAAVRHSFEAGKLLAFVAAKPAPQSASVAAHSDWQAAFDERIVLVQRHNFDALLRQYPQLFPTN